MYMTDLLIDWLHGLPKDVRFAVEGRLRMGGPDWIQRNTSNDDDESVVKALRAAEGAQVRGVAVVITAILNNPTRTDDAKRWAEAKKRWKEIGEIVTYDSVHEVYVLRGMKYKIAPSTRVATAMVFDVLRVGDGMVVASFDFVDQPDGRRQVVYLPGGSATRNSLGQADVLKMYECWETVGGQHRTRT
ncbi:hypothetical protein [Sorangium sp. So ce176]|uniref:hypothetical protein n=1 Tax=Sorangium sp. So ce176 TaxID=3133286 RepID=UPI003F60BC9E